MAIKNADRNFIERVFEEAYQKGLSATSSGHKADYIPELAKADEMRSEYAPWTKMENLSE